ncbi:PP2C family protein-serine/threonine phosphatase [Nocardioides coralli]|uniref:PP2C family protein-serine/threonine phosphatase n=1 Tax=Nocardioides coralli TaxID=2872154 RepID=UPI001CA45F33|nr:PP2C family protein-serine/threonine phosphatase [Nocardioides coralli]QZY28248.1 serine/threonine-protein phosphatase [Nocardioides coralli]
MTAVRERQARLLADPRSAEPRARLAQAMTRSDFLLRLSRTTAALQNPHRALAGLTTLLVDELVDVALVSVHTGSHETVCTAVRDQPSATATRLLADGGRAYREAIRTGVAEEVVVPSGGPGQLRVLREWLGDEDVVAAVDTLGVELLTIRPLTARGHTFGVLVLARGSGQGFHGSWTFVDELTERVASGLDAVLLVAETRYVAGVLRRALEPQEMPQLPGLDLASFYRVARQSERVGGDFVDVHAHQPDDTVLVLGDVAGKGVEAAVHAQRIRNAVHTASHVDRSPGSILALVNRVLLAEAGPVDESLATAVCARARPVAEGLRVDLANAGHVPPVVLRAAGSVEVTGDADPMLALDPDASYDDRTVVLGHGDTLLLYTDGVTEAPGTTDRFGEDRLVEQLTGLGGTVASAVVESVAVAVSEHLADRHHDDMAMLAIRYVGGDR